jgi:lambda repressor-like predicted transcriptional regulator
MKSQRADGLGHWPRGKARSTLTAAERAAVIRKLRKAVELQSIRSVARTLGLSDRAVRNVLSGQDQPTERIKALAARL